MGTIKYGRVAIPNKAKNLPGPCKTRHLNRQTPVFQKLNQSARESSDVCLAIQECGAPHVPFTLAPTIEPPTGPYGTTRLNVDLDTIEPEVAVTVTL